ncbi:MAG: LLM class F420-dependent oxidoreductase [Actinomycetales bacterium]|nr:LLM class F420-dependent oxidoreductase [Actinomycetales bacterium]
MELGLHIADFTWDGGAPVLGPRLAQHVREAEHAGITRITVMDHFWQLGGDLGPYEHDMLEAYTTLGFLAAHTQTVRLHALVTGAVYREPAVLAKQVTTLDVLSGGRAGLGIGAAWFADEARGLGIPFPPLAERFERLEETLQVCLAMWREGDEPYEGRHYRLERTLSVPAPVSRPHPYLLVGGGGERKTLRLVAQYADACNLFLSPELRHKLAVLDEHCERLGRDPATVERTGATAVDPGTRPDELLARLEDAREAGIAAVYVYAQGFSDPGPVVELLARVLPEVR